MFFNNLDFKSLLAKKVEPPFFPNVKSESDTRNFKKVEADLPMIEYPMVDFVKRKIQFW